MRPARRVFFAIAVLLVVVPLTSPAATEAGQTWAPDSAADPGRLETDGLEDIWIGAGGRAGKWSLKGVIHGFEAETGGRDFGSEVDLSASRKIGEHVSVLFKLARYNADDTSLGDTTKIWFMAGADY